MSTHFLLYYPEAFFSKKWHALATANVFGHKTQQLLLSLQSKVGRFVAASFTRRRGKSGQHRAPYFLTGSCLRGQSSVTENNRHEIFFGVRVKR